MMIGEQEEEKNKRFVKADSDNVKFSTQLMKIVATQLLQVYAK